MAKILSVATAGLKPDQVRDTENLNYPRVDYMELRRLSGAETIDYTVYENSHIGNIFRNIETQLRSDIYLASLSYLRSRESEIIFAWSERAGIPLAGFFQLSRKRKKFVAMFQCWSKRQERIITQLNLFSTMDAIIVHCESMHRHLIDIGAPEKKVHLIHYSVDQQFFSTGHAQGLKSNSIMSIGEPRSRDYKLLIDASRGLPVSLEIAASGPWYAREKNGKMPVDLPENVKIVKHLPKNELRDMYARSQFVVLPIGDELFSAGATAILESSCMERAVIATRSQGILDYVIDGETGILVDPWDTVALREAIDYLLAHPEEAQRLGQNARKRVEEELNLESYVGKIVSLLREVSDS